MRYCSPAVIAVLLTLPASAQYTERLDVRVHELEVVVENRDGTPVTNLKRDDFIVLQDRVEQPITNFSFINETAAPAETVENQTPPAEHKPRKFVFFIDQFNLYHGAREELLRDISNLVGDLDGGDEAMVVTPSQPQRVPLFFTSDKSLLMTTLDRATAEVMRQGEGIASGAPAGRCGPSLRKCVEDRLDQLAWVCRALSDVPGRKVVLVMTTMMTSVPDLQLQTPAETASLVDPREISGRVGITKDRYDRRGLVVHVARVAAASNVTIYGLESYEAGYEALPADALLETGRDAAADPGGSPLKLKSGAGSRNPGTYDLLQTLAELTGAKAFNSTRHAPAMFDQISNDLSSYYSIAYRDNESKPKEHLVEVRVRNRSDLVVRTRGTVLTRTREEEDRGLAMAAAISSHTYNPLHIRLTASPIEKHGRRRDIPLHVHIPMSRLVFLNDNGHRRAQFKVLVATIDDQGTYGEAQTEKTQDITVDASKWDDAQSNEFVYDTVVRVSPAHYRIGVGVTDATSGEAGFQTVLVDAQ